MTALHEPRPATTPIGQTGLPLLSEAPPRMGPVTRRLVRRTALTVAAIEIVGLLLTLVVGGDRATAAGLSLIFPGAGFLFATMPELFALTLVACAISIVLWWAISAVWALPLSWLTSAAVSAALAGGPRWWTDADATWGWARIVAPVLAVVAIGATVGSFERRYRAKRAKVPALNAFLTTARPPEPVREFRAPDDMDAELQRWCYELALQPIDQFDGFEWGEQFHGGTCVRYQLNYLGWALSQYAANALPNAPTEIERVLRNLVLKQTDLRVWSYWRTLNLLGNFNGDPDPLVRDNIMFSGFTGDQINLYEAVTGSTHFDEPGSLTFVWHDGRTFSYDHHTWMDAVRRNFDESESGFFPCEPGWAFAACNTIGAQSLLGYEVLHGRPLWSEYQQRWRDTLDDEYLLPDGNYANIRCTRTGLSWDTGETPGGEYLMTGSNGFVDVAPDLADRGRAIASRGLDEKLAGLRASLTHDDDGRPHLDLELPEDHERNRVRRTALGAWTKLAGAARLMGDAELLDACLRAGDRQCATGERWPERPVAAGVQTMAGHLINRWAGPHNTASLNLRGYVAPEGPIVGPVPWPQAMVTVARSTDGVTLDLSLRAVEGDPSDELTVEFTNLEPGARYRLGGGASRGEVAVQADANGVAAAAVVLGEAVGLRLQPVNLDGSP
ncbi:MAG: hypothetical protein ACRBI6_00585 [Acidimicrobiales bacterium]